MMKYKSNCKIFVTNFYKLFYKRYITNHIRFKIMCITLWITIRIIYFWILTILIQIPRYLLYFDECSLLTNISTFPLLRPLLILIDTPIK